MCVCVCVRVRVCVCVYVCACARAPRPLCVRAPHVYAQAACVNCLHKNSHTPSESLTMFNIKL